MSPQTSLSAIALLPLIGSALTYLSGRINKNISGWIATLASLSAFVVVWKLFSTLSPESAPIEARFFTWMSSINFSPGNLSIDFYFRFDQLTAVMCLIITGIGTLIHLYSIAYMAEDEHTPRFFAYLNLFMFSMLLLVLGGNLPVLFVGWEGVGLCSYLLIGFWFKNISYAAAGRKAFVVNRIGDAGFLLAMFALFWRFGTLDIEILKQQISVNAVDGTLLAFIAGCLFVGATGKSAQIPLFVWLPDAMAGPTPVSALIHAATMVTAGVYMMARLNFIFDLAPFILAIVCIVALLTAFIAATTAIRQYDIKKVLAYSTVSQLGFMFLAASVGAYWVAIFHVMTHAFFKACLFLGAGSVIHGCHHEQDMRHMGGLLKKMPITAITYGVSVLAIAGIAPLSGYYSKHAILEALAGTHNPYLVGFASWVGIIASLTAFLTAFYMTRSFAMTFLGEYRGHAHPHESPWQMTVPLLVLAGLAFIGGILPGGHLSHYLAGIVPVHGSHEISFSVSDLVHSWIGIVGVLLGLLLYTRLTLIPEKVFSMFPMFAELFSRKYYFDEIYAAVIVRPLESIANRLWKVVDQGIIDGAVNGSAMLVDVNGEIIRTTQTGQTRHYAFFMFVATVLIVVFYFVL
jgi:NADH-quinone oxidoreductase subunit L